tara:strand:- start:162 stop:470 length:309 start_codon:yes stop_codon:yes gene_type:complete
MSNSVIRVDATGAISVEHVEQEKLHTRFPNNEVTFVGSIPELDIVMLASPTSHNGVSHAFLKDALYEPIDGPIFLVGVGPNGEAQDIDFDAFSDWAKRRITA